jgi:hypothetical protein
MNDKKAKLEKIIVKEQEAELVNNPESPDNNEFQISVEDLFPEDSNQINQDSEYRDVNDKDTVNPGFSEIGGEWYYPIYLPYKNNH